MQRFFLTSGMALAWTLILPACAIHTIQIDRATSMGSAGKVATQGTRDLMERVRVTNRDLAINLAATDNNCKLPQPRLASGAGGTICRRVPLDDDRPLRRWTARELEPSLAVIEGITAYLGAVDAIITRKPVDIAGDLSKAHDKLIGIAGDLSILLNAPAPPDLTADQSKAVTATLSLLSELLDEADRVRDLTRIELKNDSAEFESSLVALERVNRAFTVRLGGQLDSQLALVDQELDSIAHAPTADRRPVATRQMEILELREAIPALNKALAKSVTVFREAHTAYRELLFDPNARLTDAEKRKVAALTEARVLAVLHDLASLTKAF